jgi:hypothetical protein
MGEKSMARERWLTCEVKAGMFPGEVAVFVQDVQGRIYSFFLSKTNVRLPKDRELNGEKLKALVRVMLLHLDKKTDEGIVALPAEPFEGPPVAKVRRAELHA